MKKKKKTGRKLYGEKDLGSIRMSVEKAIFGCEVGRYFGGDIRKW